MSGRTAFANNIIPPDRISRVARQIIEWLPLPTTSAISSNYFASGEAEFDRHSSDVKVNWNPSGRFTMFGRTSILKFSGWTPVPFGRASGGAIPPDLTEGPVNGLNRSISVGFTYIIGPTLLLDGTIGLNYVTPEALHALWGENIGLEDLQLPGTNDPNDITYSGMPQFRVSGYSTFGNPGSARPQTWHDNQRRYNANLSWIERHAWIPVRVRSLARAHEPLADRSRRRAARRLRLQPAGRRPSPAARRPISTMRSRRFCWGFPPRSGRRSLPSCR